MSKWSRTVFPQFGSSIFFKDIVMVLIRFFFKLVQIVCWIWVDKPSILELIAYIIDQGFIRQSESLDGRMSYRVMSTKRWMFFSPESPALV